MPDYCALDLPPHIALDCNEKIFGGNSAIGFLSTNKVITDYTSPTAIQAEINANRLRIVTRVKAEMPDASPIEGESMTACGPEQVLDGYNRTIAWIDGKVVEDNVDFYDTLSEWQGYILLYNCKEKTLTVEDRTTVSVSSFFSSPNSQTKPQMWKGTAKWNYFLNPRIYDASALVSIFEPQND